MFETATEDSGEEQKRDSMPTMGFLDHLEELRRRLVYSIAAVGVGFCACWWKVEKIYDIMQRPIMDALRANGMSEKLVYLNPTEPFNLYLKIAALAGLFLTSPFVLYQVWMFISPGLYRNEKRYVRSIHGFDDCSVLGGRIFRLQDRLPAGPRVSSFISADSSSR